MKSSDAILLERWTKHRDAEAFAEIVARYAGMVYGTCRRILGDATEAEDMTQECFMKLSQTDPKAGKSLGGWLHRAAMNRCLDCLKSKHRRRKRETQYSVVSAVSEEPSWQDIQTYVDEAIAELPERLRLPIISHFLEGRTHGHIANTLGISRPAVTQRIHRGTERIRDGLKKRGVPITTASLVSIMSANLTEAAPASVTAALGKLALSGTQGAAGTIAAAGTVGALGTSVLMKAIVVCAVAAVVATVGLLVLTGKNAAPGQADQRRAALATFSVEAVGEPVPEPEPPAASVTKPDDAERTAAADEQESTAAIHIRCVDKSGEPVAGAKLAVVNLGFVK